MRIILCLPTYIYWQSEKARQAGHSWNLQQCHQNFWFIYVVFNGRILRLDIIEPTSNDLIIINRQKLQSNLINLTINRKQIAINWISTLLNYILPIRIQYLLPSFLQQHDSMLIKFLLLTSSYEVKVLLSTKFCKDR